MSYPDDSPMRDSTAASSPPESQGKITQRNRKYSSTGGGRAWSNEEEAYLIETRMHKMPYKHIAAHLKKTELACRLHYHQLSFGNKRHRRASSSSVSSTAQSPTSPPRTMMDMQQRQLPPLNPSPSFDQGNQCPDSFPSSPQNHVPILPKPIPSPHRAGQQIKGLRLITEDIEQFQDPKAIDMARLNRIYNTHRTQFWSMLACSYGGNVSPSALEEAWRTEYTNSRTLFPPTPCGSPVSSKAATSVLCSSSNSATKDFNSPQQSTKSASGSFAISSLLTEDKEVRSPSNH